MSAVGGNSGLAAPATVAAGIEPQLTLLSQISLRLRSDVGTHLRTENASIARNSGTPYGYGHNGRRRAAQAALLDSKPRFP